MKRLSIAIFLFLSFLSLQAQELTNAGREFWVTSSKNILSDVMPDSALIYIMGDTLCTGYIENPNTSFYQTFTVVPDSVLVIAIPKEDILCNVPEVSIDTTHPIESKGVYIKTEKNVYVYLQTNVTNTISEFNCTQTAKVPVLPSHIFSTDIKLKGFSDPFDYSVLRLLLIIATEDNTTLFVPEIHYTGSLITYPFTVTLQKDRCCLPSHGFVYSDTTTLITTNCKSSVLSVIG